MTSPTALSFRPLAAVLVAAAVAVVGCGSGSGSVEPTSTSTTSTLATTTTAPGPAPGAQPVGFAELGVGDCFDDFEDPQIDDLAVARVLCALPHRFEVYDVVEVPAELGTEGYPGTAVVQDWAEQACFDRFEAFVGVRWTLSELDIQTWWPTQESWERGDDQVVCAVRSDDGERLTGTQRGTRR